MEPMTQQQHTSGWTPLVAGQYEMPTDGSDPFAGIEEGEGDISGIIQFWRSIINELQAAGGWFM
ncbi:hypothetical protein HaLaN_04368 [Haematococcus lacustris]|uniref:Uncharacterized protein n=1 Tax=Haematococcus lacustris TaxID=44745 RepID=A0A699YGD9_HAELA|nr:hypothetical protein HaLaN_04368 [Haematococcus lacustris]